MAGKFSDQAIVRLKGQVSYKAVEPSQRRLVSYMRQHPDATLAEARRGGPKYSKDELAHMAAEVPWEDLTSYQRKLMRNIPDEPVSAATIAYHTGIPESGILKRINRKQDGGIDSSSLVFRASRGFYGRTNQGNRRVIFYVVRSPTDSEDFNYAFGTAGAIETAIRDEFPCPSPPCDDEDDATVAIPLKNGTERDNLPASSKEIEA